MVLPSITTAIPTPRLNSASWRRNSRFSASKASINFFCSNSICAMPSKPALAARSIMDSSCELLVLNNSKTKSPNTTQHLPATPHALRVRYDPKWLPQPAPWALQVDLPFHQSHGKSKPYWFQYQSHYQGGSHH